MCFVPAKGKEVHSGNIEAVSTKEKAKFPQDFFPEVRLHCNRYFSVYEVGPKYFWNMNLPHKRDIVQGSATRCCEHTIF